jgi:hypothetical protein
MYMSHEDKIAVDIYRILEQLGIDKQKIQTQNITHSSQTTPMNAQPLQKR